MKQRTDKLLAAMPGGFEAALVSTDVNRFYFLGFDSGDAGTVLILPDKTYFIIDSRYIEIAEATVKEAEVILEGKALEQVRDNYDYVFIDCPPSLELLTLNALCAADSLLVPLQGEYYALEGLSDLMNTVRLVRRSLNPQLEIEGVLLTMFDGRTNLAIQVAQEVKRFFPGKVYATVIPRNVRLSEAPSHGKPITSYDRSCRGAEAYVQLAQEFLKRNNG